MAVDVGDLLADQHRRAQLGLRAATLRDVLRIMPALDVEDLVGTWPPVEAGLLALIDSRAPVSSALAGRYMTTARTAAGVPGDVDAIRVGADRDSATRGLRVVGPVNAGRRLAAGAPAAQVARATLVNVAGETTRQVLNAGRSTITGTAARDPHRPQIRRVTDGSPCRWCADQASRTYPPTDAFPAHGHCACFPMPVY